MEAKLLGVRRGLGALLYDTQAPAAVSDWQPPTVAYSLPVTGSSPLPRAAHTISGQYELSVKNVKP